MHWNLWGWAVFDTVVWSTLLRMVRRYCWPHAYWVGGTFTSVLAAVTGQPGDALISGGMSVAALAWWWLGGGCNKNPRWKRWLAKLGNLAGELRRAALTRTMKDRQRARPIAVPA